MGELVSEAKCEQEVKGPSLSKRDGGAQAVILRSGARCA